MQYKLKADKTSSQDLSQGALSYTTAFTRAFKLEQVLVKASVNISETITVTLDSAAGATYDTVLDTADLQGESSYVFRPTGQANFQAGDEIKVQCTNANLTGTVKLIIKTSEILQ